MKRVDLEELERHTNAYLKGDDEWQNVCIEEYLCELMPAVIEELRAARKQAKEVEEFLRAEIPLMPTGDGKAWEFQAKSLTEALEMIRVDRDIAIDAFVQSRDSYALAARRYERAAHAGTWFAKAVAKVKAASSVAQEKARAADDTDEEVWLAVMTELDAIAHEIETGES